MAKIKGMLDPGHAKSTPGKRYGSFLEYLSNRAIAVKAKQLLEATGAFDISYSVDLNADADKSLAERAAEARKQGAVFFVSIHSNFINISEVRGTETFIHTNTSASVPFANTIHSHLVDNLKTRNRGVKRANFGVLRGTYQYMLSCLTEGEFFSNAAANKWMLTEDYENKYAAGLAKGLCDFYGVKFQAAPVSTPKPAAPVKVETDGAEMIRVKVGSLWTYSRPDWEAKAEIVNKDEAFTVEKKLKVGGGYMYQLKSGLYITANSEYVEAVGRVEPVKQEDKPDLIIVKAANLWTYDRQDWNAKAVIVNKGEAFTVKRKVKVGGGYMYELKSGLYITANPQYVEYRAR